MRLYFIRHGETDWNDQKKLQGWHDVPLNEKGIILAEQTYENKLKEISFDLVITSPLKRTIETARLATGGADIPYIMEPRIMEINWGEWDGWTREQFRESHQAAKFNLFYTDPFQYPGAPGGETVRQVCERTKDFLQELIANPDYQEKTILISSHGCATRAILNSVYDDPADFWHGGVPANCAVNIAEVKDGKFSLLKEDQIYYDPALLIKNQYVPIETDC
ncbi:phosphoglycerate mutase [Mediterraneibacter butyricigenes]|uniref:phosphoglycerate mutase (2,3-diphosphoglycerate-dependent) n=1 Tax=Mediterraneibacter butyricigenes TaxID=2316025 RepID=A0A391PF08_9FIRM|nr:histidine phosphatase family protein [Mediterraneibacter butyricigenes]RGO28254.1 histidine phosphatase family protein [Dorea sp. OM02-2LB]GCA68449.1 phosphoglycerate mutase [Mediterraneibacter butyricigenes]